MIQGFVDISLFANCVVDTDFVQELASTYPAVVQTIDRNIDHQVRTANAESFEDVFGPLLEATPDTPQAESAKDYPKIIRIGGPFGEFSSNFDEPTSFTWGSREDES